MHDSTWPVDWSAVKGIRAPDAKGIAPGTRQDTDPDWQPM